MYSSSVRAASRMGEAAFSRSTPSKYRIRAFRVSVNCSASSFPMDLCWQDDAPEFVVLDCTGCELFREPKVCSLCPRSHSGNGSCGPSRGEQMIGFGGQVTGLPSIRRARE